MKKEIDRIAIAHEMTPQEAWFAVSRKFLYSSPVPVIGLSRSQVISRFHNIRSQHYGSSLTGKIEVPPLALVVGSPQLYFFQFHFVWRTMSNKRRKQKRSIDRLVGWAHPTLLALLSYKQVDLFIDGTFDCVPAGFKQCIVLMVFDEGSKLYVPVFFVLSTSKTREAYDHTLHLIRSACGKDIQPGRVVCDFERALLDAVCDCLDSDDTDVLGCYFHFKQACQKKMVQLRISKPEIKIAMSAGVLDMLTVLKPSHIWARGARWVRNKIKSECEASNTKYSTHEWRKFWRYFEETWTKLYDPDLWNVWHYVSKRGDKYKRGSGKRLVSRTNNPLERFNRTLNEEFGTSHPRLEKFIRTIEKISREYVELRNAVLDGRAENPDRKMVLELPEAVDLEDYDSASDNEIAGQLDEEDYEDDECSDGSEDDE